MAVVVHYHAGFPFKSARVNEFETSVLLISVLEHGIINGSAVPHSIVLLKPTGLNIS